MEGLSDQDKKLLKKDRFSTTCGDQIWTDSSNPIWLYY